MSIKSIICGGNQTYIVKDDGTMYSSGDNRFGQLSHGDYINTNKLELVVFKEKPSSPSIINGISDDYDEWGTPPKISYNVTDADLVDSELLVTEYVNSEKVWEGNIKNGENHDFNITNAFNKLPNGNHTIKIEVRDKQRHLVTKTSKFKKFVNSLPEIIFEKQDYGEVYSDFNVKHTIKDADKEDTGALSIMYQIDGRTNSIRNNESSGSFVYDAQLSLIPDGPHTITITVEDGHGGKSEKSVKFTKVTKYRYDKFTVENKAKGKYITTIIDDDKKYPDNGEKDGYWYVKRDKYIPKDDDEIKKLQGKSVPVISGSNIDLGSKTHHFDIPYIVTDNDDIDKEISVIEKIDNDIIKIHNVKSATSNNMVITEEMFKKLSIGRHTCYIIATDKQNNVVIRTYEFIRNVSLGIIFTKDTNLDLGNKDNKGFEVPYKISGNEGKKCTIIEKVNDTVLNKYSQSSDSVINTLKVTKEIIEKLKNNTQYTIHIEVKLDGTDVSVTEQKMFRVKYNEISIRNLQTDYGSHIKPFDVAYKVKNDYYDNVNCFEYIDDNQVWAGPVANDVTKKFTLNFDNVGLGYHTMRIVAIDKNGIKTERISSFTKIDKSNISDNRFGLVPLSHDKIDIAVPNELVMDQNTGHFYSKNPFGKVISKTEELEKLIYWCIESLYTINSEGIIVSKITEVEQLMQSIIDGVYKHDIGSESKIKPVETKTEKVIEKLKAVSHIGNTPPSNTNTLLWVDTNDYVLKTYIDGKWETLLAGWI